MFALGGKEGMSERRTGWEIQRAKEAQRCRNDYGRQRRTEKHKRCNADGEI